MDERTLTRQLYGVSDVVSKNNRLECHPDPRSVVTIFDDYCFMFYMLKYVEHFGAEPLIALLAEY